MMLGNKEDLKGRKCSCEYVYHKLCAIINLAECWNFVIKVGLILLEGPHNEKDDANKS